ncbi:MAG: two-component system response regulator [Methylocystaceae bacterium]|nr:MAG: two-component system response regulator [Methylocystaceae bacterium]
MRALLVEDEPEMARSIGVKLGRSGFVADSVGTIADARESLRLHRYAFALLDRRLPDGDGITLLPDMRRRQPGIRILILTACDAVNERISGLDAGADDYMTKPFDSDELMARIRTCLRRPGADLLPPITIGSLSFDLNIRELSVAGRPVVLHRRELALIDVLARHAGRVVLRTTLLEEIYGFDDEVQANALNILVSRMRRRLSELNAGVEIHSARGIGYMLTKPST